MSKIPLILLTALLVPISLWARQVSFTVDTQADLIDTNLADGVCPAGSCSLRAAIMQANVMGVSVTIIVPALPSGETYRVVRPVLGANGPDEGDLNLTTPSTPPTDVNPQLISIVGAGANTTIIESNGVDRVLSVAITRRAAISGVTIRGGVAPPGSASQGGGINNRGRLTLTQVTLSNNRSTEGAGVSNVGGGSLEIIRSTLNANQATLGGAVLNFSGTASVVQSTLIGNGATGSGGGIHNGGNLIVVNSTVSQNFANTNGGGIWNSGTVNMYSSSVMFNGADEDADPNGGTGGGIWNSATATFNMRNTLVAGNYVSNTPTADECFGTLSTYSRNIIGVNVFPAFCTIIPGPGSNQTLNSLALIGPLQNNGGPTGTHALLSGSNAIDGAEAAGSCIDSGGLPLSTDQRGAPREVDGDNNGSARCDIGPYELQPPPTITAHPQSQPIAPGNTAALSVMATGTAPVSYQWYVGISGTTTNPISGATSSNYTTPALTSTTSYWVRVSNFGSTANSTTATITVNTGFTDDPLIAGASVIRAVHITQLRARIDAQRVRFGLLAYGWTDLAIAVGTDVRAVHITQLRTALSQAYTAGGIMPLPTYTDPNLAAGTQISAAHIAELRAAVVAIE